MSRRLKGILVLVWVEAARMPTGFLPGWPDLEYLPIDLRIFMHKTSKKKVSMTQNWSSFVMKNPCTLQRASSTIFGD